jgi:orotate phosphoribosyltransferase
VSNDAILLSMDPRLYANEGPFLDEERILSWFGLAGAFWGYEGDPSFDKPHAELTSGLCSNGYFDCPRLLSYPNVAEILARQLALGLKVDGIQRVDWVISSAYSAITFGHEVAKGLGARFMNVEKDPADPNQKRMLWRRITLPAGSRVLRVEELITTMGTTEEVTRAVVEGNGEPIEILPVIGTLVLRPSDLEAVRRKHQLVALVEKEIWAKKPEECPLCAVGSPRFKPKTHWAQLTGKG